MPTVGDKAQTRASTAELEQLARKLTRRGFKAGLTIAREGKQGDKK